ncbi:MAG: hypothetical protein S4CHLAM37_10350 [Chlamydiia bacterium]|nr:hypothetical protein [Chlamydiia bacterium]
MSFNLCQQKMEKLLKSESAKVQMFYEKVKLFEKEAYLPKKVLDTILVFFHSYEEVLHETHQNIDDYIWIFLDYLDLLKKQIDSPYDFEPYHQMVKEPYDYHHFGKSFLEPLVHFENSDIIGVENLKKINKMVANGENVVLFANHQIEADPQAIYVMLAKQGFTELSEKMIFVAGERVIKDPISVPFSLGCNLLCIYSKRYIDNPPENKNEKQLHNNRTMKRMGKLLGEGGHCIYVAPSGGRDRPDEKGNIIPAEFDAQSIEMFYLISRHSKKKTHFFPLALSTYTILPPPETVQTELGEHRVTKGGSIRLNFGDEVDLSSLSLEKIKDKHLRRKAKAEYIYNLICEDYSKIV